MERAPRRWKAAGARQVAGTGRWLARPIPPEHLDGRRTADHEAGPPTAGPRPDHVVSRRPSIEDLD
jgi:hypothetical protein